MDFSKFLFNILYGSKIAKGLVWAVEVILNKPKCDLNLSSSGTSQCLTALSLVLVFLSKGKQILLAQLISVLYVFWIPLKWLLILSLLGAESMSLSQLGTTLRAGKFHS
jgi:hypothetical protein